MDKYTYTIKNPQNVLEEVTDMAAYCKLHGLDPSTLHRTNPKSTHSKRQEKHKDYQIVDQQVAPNLTPYEHRKRQKVKIREYVQQVKLERGCEGDNCQWAGEFSYEQLQFDHLDRTTKVANVSYMVGKNINIGQIKAEIAKCQVLCANCHAKKTRDNGDHL